MKVEAFTDGGNRWDRAACAAVIHLPNGKKVKRSTLYLGEYTNMVMEYLGVILALETALELGATEITIYTDNQTVERHLLGEYQVRSPNMKVHYDRCMELAEQFEAIFIKWVPREWNGDADKLCRKTMDGKRNAFREAPPRRIPPPQVNPFNRP